MLLKVIQSPMVVGGSVGDAEEPYIGKCIQRSINVESTVTGIIQTALFVDNEFPIQHCICKNP